MFIHLGKDTVVLSDEVIAIIDFNMYEASKINQNFIKQYEENDGLVKLGEEKTKSFVVTKNKIFCSPISSYTIKKRANFMIGKESR